MYFPILIGVENVRFSSWKIDDHLWNMLILNLNFEGEGHSLANCLFYILIISRKCLALKFLTRGIRMFFAIL